MRQWFGSALVLLTTCHRIAPKQLPESMRTYCQLDNWDKLRLTLNRNTNIGPRNELFCQPVILSGYGLLFFSVLAAARLHDDVIIWKHFPRYWPFVRGIYRSPVNYPHKGQWRGTLMLSLICARKNGWANNGEAGDLRRHRAHYDIIVMYKVWTWSRAQLWKRSAPCIYDDSLTLQELQSLTETEMSSFWWNFHHWLHWKLSKWQLPVQPVIKISSKWRHFRFSDC